MMQFLKQAWLLYWLTSPELVFVFVCIPNPRSTITSHKPHQMCCQVQFPNYMFSHLFSNQYIPVLSISSQYTSIILMIAFLLITRFCELKSAFCQYAKSQKSKFICLFSEGLLQLYQCLLFMFNFF